MDKAKGLKRMLNTFTECLSAIFTAAALLICAGCLHININERVNKKMTFLCGYKLVYIESGSMEPEIGTGSFIVIKQAGYDDVYDGDIITFETADGFVTHRLIGEDATARERGESAFLITKGDANSIEDIDRLAPSDIRGRVVWII